MPSKNPAQRLSDIVENIDTIRAFVAGFEFSSFRADRKTVYAVVRALEIISEATRRLPDELLQRHPHLDWKAIGAAGNVYRHEYEVVDEALVRNTVQNGLEQLQAVAREELVRTPAVPDGLLP